jgi:serine/threonine protein kinase
VVSIYSQFEINVPDSMPHDSISVPKLYALEMEYCDRGDAEQLQQNYLPRPVPPDLTFAMSSMLSHGCDALHRAGPPGIVHCDLKPANLLLKFVRNSCDLKIADFGLCCFEGSPCIGGSDQYMAPEQLEALASDSDIIVTRRR